MNPILYQSRLDAHLRLTYEGYNNSIDAIFSFEGLSLQKRLLYFFLRVLYFLLYKAEYRPRDTFYQIKLRLQKYN